MCRMTWNDARRAILAEMKAKGLTRGALVRAGLARQVAYPALDEGGYMPRFDTIDSILKVIGRDWFWLVDAVLGKVKPKKPAKRLDFSKLEKGLDVLAAELERVKELAAA